MLVRVRNSSPNQLRVCALRRVRAARVAAVTCELPVHVKCAGEHAFAGVCVYFNSALFMFGNVATACGGCTSWLAHLHLPQQIQRSHFEQSIYDTDYINYTNNGIVDSIVILLLMTI